jgi:nicotinamide-nucleotide amidase
MSAASCIDDTLVRRAEITVQRLRKGCLSLVTAESCTAGLISAILSQVDGAGDVLQGSFVAYSKDHKAQALGVARDVMQREGTVNSTVVAQMLQGALERSPAEIGVAVSGVLGPSDDEDGNPVGLVYIAVQRKGQEAKVQRHDYGRRPHDQLRRQVVLDAFALIEGTIQP